MAGEVTLSFSVASVLEDVLQQHGNRLRDIDLESRKVEEAALRRYEAAGWLRRMAGVVAAKDLPTEPSEEELRLGLRSGIILCNVLNKIQPGAVPKVVESSCDSALIPDGAALSAFQYFENVRNFLVAIQEMGIPTFEASDLEQGGKSARVVNSILALKSYNEWKQSGAIGAWKFGGNMKVSTSAKSFVRKNSEPFTNSLSKNSSMTENSFHVLPSYDLDPNKMSSSHSLSVLVRAVLLNKKPEEVVMAVESMLNKVGEELECRIANQHELAKPSHRDEVVSNDNKSVTKSASADIKIESESAKIMKKECFQKICLSDEESKSQFVKQQKIFNQQHRNIQELKDTIHSTKASMQFMQMKFHEEVNNFGLHIHGLAHAAYGYHKVLEENRKLYNQVQDLKGSIRVYCRVRPFLPDQQNYVSSVDHIDDGTITINTSSKNGKGCRSFSFNRVFGPLATQAEVFSDMQPLIRSVLDGYNVCIFAYGQTGSGKTYTMAGPRDLIEKSRGVNYRALGDLFLIADQRKDTFLYDVSVQMIEIYNEQVRDLLVVDGTNKRLEIRNSSHKGLSVPDANLVPVSSTSDVIDLMNIGQRNRAVGATALNDRSSRSHSCLTVHVQGKDLTSGTVLHGCMHLVDLAGSERVNKSEVTGDRLKEAQHINKSLSALGDVIASLAQKNSHVPYRNSKLTQLLQDSLGGQAKTLMFVHISPEPDAVAETISTLKFAERVATVELGAAKVNKDATDVKVLKEQIATLKAALTRKDSQAEHNQRSVSGSSSKHRSKASQLSPYHSTSQGADSLGDYNICRQPMNEVSNPEPCNKSALRSQRQSFDLDEALANSPPWPPLKSPVKNYAEDDKDMGNGDWVDKVMVNKLEVNRDENPLGSCWGADNGHFPEIFYQKYLQDSKLFPEQSDNMFMGNTQFNSSSMDDMDDLDAATSDSSEPDLLWQFNQKKLTGIINNSIESKSKKINPRLPKSPDISKGFTSSIGGPSPSKKPVNRALHSRQPAPVDMKRKTGNRK